MKKLTRQEKHEQCMREIRGTLSRCSDLLCLAYCQCVFTEWYWALFSRYARMV